MRSRHGNVFTGFGPAVSKDALTKISAEVRSWGLHTRTTLAEKDRARWINRVIEGWMNYYGEFYKPALYPLLRRINGYLMRWLRKKYRRLRTFKKAHAAWRRTTRQYPRFFAQWRLVHGFWQEGGEEPRDGRRSRRDLREPGGAIPPGD